MATDEQTSTSGQEVSFKWQDANRYYDSLVVQEPFFVYNNKGHSGLDDIFARMKRCDPFDRIITKVPARFLLLQTLAFYAFWDGGEEDTLDSISIWASDNVIADDSFNLLEAVSKTYDLEDSGKDIFPDMPSQLIKESFQAMTLLAIGKQAVSYDMKGMERTRLRPEFRLLFDVIHKVLRSQKGTNDKLTHDKFKIMVAVYHNLPVNWGRLLVLGMKGEAMKVKTSVDDDGDTLLTIKRKFNFCLKISLIFQTVVERAGLEDSIPLNESIKLPLNQRQFNMSLGIIEASLITLIL